VPQIRRTKPAKMQIAEHYKNKILTGELRSGDRIDSVRLIAREWQVGQGTAQDAIGLLKTWGLVSTGAEGTFVNGKRASLGPQQRLRMTAAPASETARVTFAGFIDAPEYVIPILGLTPDASGRTLVIRREWVTADQYGDPLMLAVSWAPPEAADAVPELLELKPLPDPAGGARMLAERTGRAIEWGQSGREARRVRDDEREARHLGLEPGAHVLAEVWIWGHGMDVLEYGEFIVPEGKVIESDLEP
jgi:GntR family transcriptional regulator